MLAAQTVKPERAVAACSARRHNEHLIGQLLTRRLGRHKMYGFASPCETLTNEWVLITLTGMESQRGGRGQTATQHTRGCDREPRPRGSSRVEEIKNRPVTDNSNKFFHEWTNTQKHTHSMFKTQLVH